MGQLTGARTTYQTVNQEARNIRRVDRDIYLLEPEEGPLITLLNYLNKRKGTDNPKFEHLEDDYVARWAVNGEDTINANASSTTITVTDGTLFVPGDLVIRPRAIATSTKPEMMRVTTVTGNALTVVRNIGNAGLDTINAGDALRIIGSAYAENADTPGSKATAPVTLTGYTQIFRTSWSYSGTQKASSAYGAPQGEHKREEMKKWKEHRQKMNGQFIWGIASESLASAETIRTSHGINSVISTNVTDGGGVLTKKRFDAFARQAFRYGKPNKVLLCSSLYLSAFLAWQKGFLKVDSKETSFGLKITKVETGHGTWTVARDYMLEDGVAGKNGFSGWAFSLDFDEIDYRYLNGNGENRDTHLRENVGYKKTDGDTHEILTEAGLQIRREKYHAKMYNVTDYME